MTLFDSRYFPSRAFETTRRDGRTLTEISRRPETTASQIAAHLGSQPDGRDDSILLVDRVMNDCRYESFIARADREIRRQRGAEHASIPSDLDFAGIQGLRREATEVLVTFQPRTLGQAGRLAGVNPADVSLLQVAMKRHRAASGTKQVRPGSSG